MKARLHGADAGRGSGATWNGSRCRALPIAPRLSALLRKTSYGDVGLYCHFEQVWGKEAADEARALIAVARAAARCDEINGSKPGPRDAALREALARLRQGGTP